MENLKRLINYLPQPAWLTVAGHGQSYLNYRWQEYTGGVTESWVDAVHPDFRDEIIESWEFSLHNKQRFETDCLLRRYDTQYRWHRITAAPVENYVMGDHYWIATGVDIDELVVADRASDEEKLFIQHAIETAPDILYVYDLVKQQLVFRNRLKPEWRSPEELSSMRKDKALKYVSAEVLEVADYYCEQWYDARSEEVREIEYSLNTGDRTVTVRSRARIFMRDEEAGIFMITGSLQDLTGSNKSLKHLIQSEKMNATGHFARAIAHEIRNPLTNVNLALDGIRQEALHLLGRSKNFLEYIDIISRNTDRIKNMIEDILYSVRPEGEEKSVVSIADIVEDALNMLEDRILLRGIKVKKDFEDKCDIEVYRKSLQIAFMNIILNAIEALDNEGDKHLAITIENKENTCCIIVHDSGNGIPEEAKDKIFEPFFSTKPSGVGIGLTNAQAIIHDCGGTIECESVTEDGTKFIICFPIA